MFSTKKKNGMSYLMGVLYRELAGKRLPICRNEHKQMRRNCYEQGRMEDHSIQRRVRQGTTIDIDRNSWFIRNKLSYLVGVLGINVWYRKNELSHLVGVLDRDIWYRKNELSHLVGVLDRDIWYRGN